jgi:hypothetical protein
MKGCWFAKNSEAGGCPRSAVPSLLNVDWQVQFDVEENPGVALVLFCFNRQYLYF